MSAQPNGRLETKPKANHRQYQNLHIEWAEGNISFATAVTLEIMKIHCSAESATSHILEQVPVQRPQCSLLT